MDRTVRIDNLPQVCRKTPHHYYENIPIWTDEFADWLDNNSNQLQNIHSYEDPVQWNKVIVLEFKNSEDATVFAMQFAS